MIRSRQPIHGQHSERCSNCRGQNREFKCNRNERRPAVKRLTRNIQGKTDYARVILQEKAEAHPAESARKDNSWQTSRTTPDHFREALDWHWGEGVNSTVALAVSFFCRMH